MNEPQWWNDPKWVADITLISKDMSEKYADKTIISVGQSPAWITMGIGMIRKMQGQKAGVSYIPFTGCFMEAASTREMPARASDPDPEKPRLVQSFKAMANRNVSAESSAAYQGFLKRHHIAPEDLAARAQDGERFVFCDLTRTGGGLASFMSEWVKESTTEQCAILRESLECVTFTSERHTPRTHFHLEGKMTVPVSSYVLDDDRYDRLLNTSAGNSICDKSTRLMPVYQLYATPAREAGYYIPHNAPIVAEIKETLHRDIQTREHGAGWPGLHADMA